MLFEPGNLADQKARIVVIGVGGGGGNALNRMIGESASSCGYCNNPKGSFTMGLVNKKVLAEDY